MKKVVFTTLIVLITLSVTSCIAVKPWEREQLADPIMEPKSLFSKQKLDDKFFSSREGSMGGSGGIGGGCGCAK